MAIHSSILAWRIPWTEEPGRLQGSKESDTTEVTEHLGFSIGKPWRYHRFSSRPLQWSEYDNKANHTYFVVVFSVYKKKTFILYVVY